MRRSILRFAVGAKDGPHSTVWRIWGEPKGDVYAAVRTLGGIVKASFHKDGKCHVGFTSGYSDTATRRFGTPRRHWETWRLPQAPVTRILRLLIPRMELREFPPKYRSKVIWIPAPKEQPIAVISVFMVVGDIDLQLPTDATEVRLVGRVDAGNRKAWVIYAPSPVEGAWVDAIEDARRDLRRLPRPEVPGPGLRATIWDSRPDHDRCVIELAYDPDQAESDTTAPDEANVRLRAYFLWENRTGRDWQNPASNWAEAEEIERDLVLPHDVARTAVDAS